MKNKEPVNKYEYELAIRISLIAIDKKKKVNQTLKDELNLMLEKLGNKENLTDEEIVRVKKTWKKYRRQEEKIMPELQRKHCPHWSYDSYNHGYHTVCDVCHYDF